MNKKHIKNLVAHVMSGELDKANKEFRIAFDSKYRTALESRKIAVASKIYSKKA